MSDGPNRSTTAGSAYLDLRKLARATGRPTDELMQLYGLEGFLDRFARSSHCNDFVLKGGVLLAVCADRRPTRDIDFAANQISVDFGRIRSITNDILSVPTDDGITFDLDATSVEVIREHETYPSIRAKVAGNLAKARIRFHVDINVGDPLWPDPRQVELPRLLDGPPLQLRGYAVELILAEKIVTAIQRGTANTRWRDFVDIAALAVTPVDQDTLRESIRRVAAHRQTEIEPLSQVLDGFAPNAQGRWVAWRRRQDLTQTPEAFSELLADVVKFSDLYLR